MSERKYSSLVSAVEMAIVAHHTQIFDVRVLNGLENARIKQLDHEQYLLVALAMLQTELNATGSQHAKHLLEDVIVLLEELVHEPIEETLKTESLVQLDDGAWMLVSNDELQALPGVRA